MEFAVAHLNSIRSPCSEEAVQILSPVDLANVLSSSERYVSVSIQPDHDIDFFLFYRIVARHGRAPQFAFPFLYQNFWQLGCVVSSYRIALCLYRFSSLPSYMFLVQDTTVQDPIKVDVYDPRNSFDSNLVSKLEIDPSITRSLQTLLQVDFVNFAVDLLIE